MALLDLDPLNLFILALSRRAPSQDSNAGDRVRDRPNVFSEGVRHNFTFIAFLCPIGFPESV
jgi:hypothetical protein